MIQEMYNFNWNTTDKQIQQQQNSNSERLERMWRRESDETFRNWGNFATALITTHQLLSNNVLIELFLSARHLVKVASKLILVWIAPWGGDDPPETHS